MALPKDIELANELEEVMDERTEIEAQLAPLKEREEAIRAELTQYLQKVGREYTRTSSGLGLGLVKGRVTYAIRKLPGAREEAVKWAMKEYPGILTISSADLNKVAAPLMELPEFIERKTGEAYLSVRTTENA
jgi:uncharacterized coiled-coil DUF342 family protein